MDISQLELEITWKRTIKIWWSYLWRNLIAIVASMFAGAIIGFIIGFAMGAMGIENSVIQIITSILGGIAGLAFSIVPLKLILGKNFGEFRLVLVANDSSDEI